MRLKGVCYDVGREMMGRNWRPDFDPSVTRREIEIIRRDLHCNAIRLQGVDLDRLVTAARFALDQGLDVWFSPELWDREQTETIEYMSRAAERAHALEEEYPGRIVVSVGSELLLFSKGFIPGENVLERLGNPRLREHILSSKTRESLNAFLASLASAARRSFRGKLTYASLGFEQVDWGPFDYVAADLYRGDPMFDRYPEILRRYTSMGKPFVNAEFGCCTFRGAERMGGRGWEAVDRSVWPPRLKGPYVYDQTAQANELSALLQWNEEAGVYGTFVFTFIETGASLLTSETEDLLRTLPFDPDLPRYALVKTHLDRRAGIAYPEMRWEPKESFRSVSQFYGSH